MKTVLGLVEDAGARAVQRVLADLLAHVRGQAMERDRIRAALTEAGIGSATYYTTPLHLQPALRYLGYEAGSLPETEAVAKVNFSVPLWPGMPAEAQERVVDVVRSVVRAGAAAA